MKVDDFKKWLERKIDAGGDVIAYRTVLRYIKSRKLNKREFKNHNCVVQEIPTLHHLVEGEEE